MINFLSSVAVIALTAAGYYALVIVKRSRKCRKEFDDFLSRLTEAGEGRERVKRAFDAGATYPAHVHTVETPPDKHEHCTGHHTSPLFEYPPKPQPPHKHLVTLYANGKPVKTYLAGDDEFYRNMSNCRNCGAPLVDHYCRYCGTTWTAE